MNHKEESKVTIGNKYLMIFLCYTFSVIFVEWINLLVFQTGISYIFGVAEFISLIIVVYMLFKIYKQLDVKKIQINVEILVGIVLIVFLGIITSAFVDNGFDTYNYHLIAQNPKFTNYFTDDFGYGNFQVWGFRLPDRLFYYFRFFFGFRFGTILNSLVLSLSFVQIYSFLENNCTAKNESSKMETIFCNRFMWSMIIILQLDAVFMYGTYYVDVVSLPIAIEIMRILLEERKEIHTTKNIIYFALLSGLWIAFKLTNVIYVVPCVLVYLFQHGKHFKIFDWFISIACGMCSWLDYIIFNWTCTRNPVFPYFNKIFKSIYFPNENFKDVRWGGETIQEKIMWVFYAAFNPEYRQSEIYDERPVLLQFALIGTFVLLLIYVVLWFSRRKKISSNYFVVFTIAVSSSLMWGMTTGYSRYFLFGKILWGILAFYFVIILMRTNRTILSAVAGVCSVIIVFCSMVNISSMLSGRNWSWTKYDMVSYCKQLNYVFKDHDITNDYNQDIDLFVLTDQTVMGIAELIDDSVYAINTNYSEMTELNYDEILNQHMDKAKRVCDIHRRDFGDIADYVAKLNANGFYINDINCIHVGAGDYMLLDISKDARQNQVWTSVESKLIMDVSNVKRDRNQLSFMFGTMHDGVTLQGMYLKVIVKNSSGDRELYSEEIDDEIKEYSIPIQLEQYDESIEIYIVDGNGDIVNSDETNQAIILNANIIDYEK